MPQCVTSWRTCNSQGRSPIPSDRRFQRSSCKSSHWSSGKQWNHSKCHDRQLEGNNSQHQVHFSYMTCSNLLIRWWMHCYRCWCDHCRYLKEQIVLHHRAENRLRPQPCPLSQDSNRILWQEKHCEHPWSGTGGEDKAWTFEVFQEVINKKPNLISAPVHNLKLH